MKHLFLKSPFITRIVRGIDHLRNKFFFSTEQFWDSRYKSGGTSGDGSYDKLAKFKADTINTFVKNTHVNSVLELGCGDGNQLRLATYPNYLGFDISDRAIELCREIFRSDSSKEFKLLNQLSDEKADLVLSLDVIYHLIEDHLFEQHMQNLFSASLQYVIIYASNTDKAEYKEAAHIKHRKFSIWIEKNQPEWTLTKHIENPYPYTGDTRHGSFSDFFIYEHNKQ